MADGIGQGDGVTFEWVEEYSLAFCHNIDRIDAESWLRYHARQRMICEEMTYSLAINSNFL